MRYNLKKIIFLLIVFNLFVCTCRKQPNNTLLNKSGFVNIKITFSGEISTLPLEKQKIVDEIEINLYKGETFIRSANLERQGNTGTLSLELDPGSNYKIEANAYENNKIKYSGESTVFSISAGQTTPVEIELDWILAVFDIDNIPSLQFVDNPFSVTIRAQDSLGNTITSFNQSANLTDLSGTVSPSVITFTSGVWTGDIYISQPLSDNSFRVSFGTIQSSSNEFTVLQVTTTTINASGTSGTISVNGEQHWYKFRTTTAGTYFIETSGSLDSYLELRSSLSTSIESLIESDDDGGVGTSSKITIYLNAETDYYVMIRGSLHSDTGPYSISITKFNSPQNLIASDGDYSDKVHVSWTAPVLKPLGKILGDEPPEKRDRIANLGLLNDPMYRISKPEGANSTESLEGYDVYRSTSQTGSFSKINTSTITNIYFDDISASSSGTHYWYYAIAKYIDPTGDSEASNIDEGWRINTYTITITAGTGGTISPSGTVSVNSGSSQTFTITPNSGYRILSVTVDGASQGAVSSYTFSNVTTSHTISATFAQAGTVTDIDGNVYQTIKIGNQWWMAENLKVANYRNGDPIPIITDNSVWTSLSSGAYCTYDNNVSNADTYGHLYNWYAVNDSRNISPEGWHVPTDEEWIELETYLGTNAGGKLKEVGTAHWDSPNTGATNESGFTALPGGNRFFSDGNYTSMGNDASFWSSSEGSSDGAWGHSLNYNDSDVSRYDQNKKNGFSVRCVMGESITPTYTITATAGTGGTISPSGEVTVNSGSSQTFTITSNTGYHITDVTVDDVSQGAVTSYTFTNVTANHTISASFGQTETGTVTDIDGNVYQTIKIGNQEWMVENLKVTRYRNGETIPNVTDNTEWGSLSTGAYSTYDNNASNADTYGNLYNWYAVNDGRNIAPEGWHVPTDEEWKELEMYLGISQSEANGTEWRGTNEGSKLKEAGTAHWKSPNEGATNESGFSALPGGYRDSDYGFYNKMGEHAHFWSSNEGSSSIYAWARILSYGYSGVYRYSTNKCYGFSVRCIKGESVTPTYTITASAGTGGTISPSDDVTVNSGSSQTFTITPNTGYHIVDVLVDDVSQGAVTSYTFTNVTANHTISATFAKLETGTVTDIDGNVYNTVKICDQWWMAENLKVTSYRNGDAIPNVTDNTEWSSLSSGAYCTYDNNLSNADTYGHLYNWYSVNDSRNIAPEGWHVPTDEEWQELVDYLGGSSVAGGKLKEAGTSHWDSPNAGATDESGFTGLPGGHRNDANGNYYSMGRDASFWSSSEYSSSGAWMRYLSDYIADLYHTYYGKSYGLSVRCVKGEVETLVINTSSLPNGIEGTSYSETLEVSGGTGTYTWWSLDSGTLPPGLILSTTGTISGTPTQFGTFTFIVKVTSDPQSVTQELSITIEPKAPTITTSAGIGGTISPSGTVTVNSGSSQTFTITPNSGYSIASVSVDGVSQGAISSYTFSNVTADHTISATFAINTYTITSSAGTGGTISPSGTVTVNSGSSQTFTITPNSGFSIVSVTVDGVSKGAISSYTFNSVTAHHTISATFLINPETGTVTDIDGNVYQTVKIGNQWWMAENLKVTRYRNGYAIPNVTDNSEWESLSTGAYCIQDHNVSNADIYGHLYNGYAVDDSRNIAPEGWHVPTDEEWKEMEMYLGMSQAEADGNGWRGTNEGGKLKEVGTTHWYSPNEGATNETGFTALPGGRCSTMGWFYAKTIIAYFWSSSEYNSTSAWYRYLSNSNSGVWRYYNGDKHSGYSVRCVKD
ncbi:FISUMP domain-containing protein [candidate division KSB1 bacterium]